jgi:hypothetical protein
VNGSVATLKEWMHSWVKGGKDTGQAHILDVSILRLHAPGTLWAFMKQLKKFQSDLCAL